MAGVCGVVYGSEGAGDGLDGGGDSIETHGTLLGGKDSNLQLANSGGKKTRSAAGGRWVLAGRCDAGSNNGLTKHY